MTVQDLINELNEVEDKTRIVILQKDAEGNGYSPLRGADDNAVYQFKSIYSGEVYPERLTQELIARGYSDEDVRKGTPAVVLFPIN